ncbi:MAG: hypothetical protein MR508_04030 [Lachnospiraceae bacterium]|nr:hypothetical protein [Lachnospiraceae bacterium]
MRKNRDDILLFVLFLLVIEFYYYNYHMMNAEFDLFEWVIETLNDRFIVLLIQGMAVNITAYCFLIRLVENSYRVLRYGNCRNLIVEAEKGLAKLSLRVILILLVVMFGVALVGEGRGVLKLSFGELRLIAFLEINIFLFQFVLGNILFFFLTFGIKEKIAAFLAMGLLFCNYAVSNDIFYAEKPFTKLTWVGNVLITSEEAYSIHFHYWMTWIVVLLGCCLLRMYVPWNQLFVKVHTRYINWIIVALVSFSTFTIFVFAGKSYITISSENIAADLMQYFYGFQRMDLFMLLYLLYQLPIWILAYIFLEYRMNIFFVQYLLRGKSVIYCLIRVVAGMIADIALYYAIGIGTLALWSRNIIGETNAMYTNAGSVILMIFNLFLQSMLIIMVAFEIGLWLEEQKHISMVITISAHLVLVLVSETQTKLTAWIPLSGGVYCSHSNCQIATCISQLVYMLLLLTGISRTFISRYEKIIEKKGEV